MASQPSALPSDTLLDGSAGSCGCLAQVLSAGVLLTALLVLSLLLIAGNPDRWQGIADPAAHPLVLVSDPVHPQTLYLGTEQGHLLISHDGGQHWSERQQGLPPTTPISALALLPGGTDLLAGTSAGAYLIHRWGDFVAARWDRHPAPHDRGCRRCAT